MALTLPSLCKDRGTRQGCPFSPLPFNLAVDPLLQHLDAWPDFQGILFGTEEIELTAFADDLLLFVSRPQMTLLPLLEENIDKSDALLLTGPSHPL